MRFPSEIATPTRVRCGGGPWHFARAAGGGVWSADPAPRTWTPSPDHPGPASAASYCTRAGTQPQGRRAPRTLPGPGAGRRAEVTSAPKEMANRKCHIATPKQSKSQPPNSPRPTTLSGGAGPRSRECGPGSPPHIRAPRPKFTLVARGASWALLLGAQPSRLDRDSTPRVSRSDGSPSGDVARAPPALRATPRSQVSAVLARPSSAHCGSGCATPPPDGHYLWRNS